MRNKKGNFPDVLTWFEYLIGFFIIAGMIIVFTDRFDDQVQLMNETMISPEIKATSSDYASYIPIGADFLFLMISLIFFGFSVFAARLIKSSFRFILIAIMALIALPLGALIIENIWDGWVQQTTLATAFGQMLFMPFILDHLVYFTVFYSAVIAVTLLSKEQ